MRKVGTCLFAGLTVGGAVAVLSQGRNVADVFTSALVGYSQESRVPELASLLRSGGIAGTRDMVILLCSAGVYTGITELSGMMEAAIRPAIGRIKTRTSFLMATMGVSVLSAAFASNQAMSVILPARPRSQTKGNRDVSGGLRGGDIGFGCGSRGYYPVERHGCHLRPIAAAFAAYLRTVFVFASRSAGDGRSPHGRDRPEDGGVPSYPR